MLIKSVCIRKHDLTTVDESCSLERALRILEESGYRCVPILDETGTIFRGNIYKMHIYRHKANGGDMNLPVTYLLKNATKVISTESSFFKVFFTIKELPYIAVLDEHHHFYGILTHSKLLTILSQSWNITQGRYVLTIASAGRQGDLAAMTKIVSRYSPIASCITLDIDEQKFIHRTLLTLPAETNEKTCQSIIRHLEKKEYRVVSVENLKD